MAVKVKAQNNAVSKRTAKSSIISDKKGLNDLINRIAKTSNKLGEMIHQACIGIVLHSLEPQNKKDVSLASRLIDKLGGVDFPVSRTNAIISWFEEYGAMKWNAGKKSFHTRGAVFDNLVDEFAKDAATVIERLQSISPFKHEKQPVYGGFDLIAAVQALISKANKLKDDEDKKQQAADNDKPWNFDGLDELIAFGNKLNAEADKAGQSKQTTETTDKASVH